MDRPKVFICYAREDNDPSRAGSRWVDRVRQFLSPFEQDEEIEVFHDDNVPVGKEWDGLIMRQVAECSVAVLLCSPAFLASKYIRDREMPVLLRRWKAGEILLVPLLISECLLDDVSYRFPDPRQGPNRIRISDIQLAGRTLEPLADLDRGKQDRILKEASQAVIRHARSLTEAAPHFPVAPPPAPVVNGPQPVSISGHIVPVPKSNPWVNSLGMRFVPVPGTDTWFNVWQTRVEDYAAYAKANPEVDGSWKDPVWLGVPVTPGPTHPVVNVSWNDAMGFCGWLTEKERRDGCLPVGRVYRLPTDREWSVAVGLAEEPGRTPMERDEKVLGFYPWGTQWPPPLGAGNFADETAKRLFGASWEHIGGYDDGYPSTSPVGQFPLFSTGLYDLAGNVWEWCEDWYDETEARRVLRGGSWNDTDRRNLLSSYRYYVRPNGRRINYGFRVVLALDGFAR